jgi:hypothetical protein
LKWNDTEFLQEGNAQQAISSFFSAWMKSPAKPGRVLAT